MRSSLPCGLARSWGSPVPRPAPPSPRRRTASPVRGHPARGRVEADFLDAVDVCAKADAQDLPPGTSEAVGARIGRLPRGQHPVVGGRFLRGQAGQTGDQRRPGLGVNGVEHAVRGEVRMERHEPETGAEPAVVPEVRADGRAHIQVHLGRAIAEQVKDAVEIGHEQAPGAVGELAEVVDAASAPQPAIARFGGGPRLGHGGELVQGHRQARGHCFGRDRVSQRCRGVRWPGCSVRAAQPRRKAKHQPDSQQHRRRRGPCHVHAYR